jgi:hypothetical protein
MSSGETIYLIFAVGAFVFFGVALAGAVAYSNGGERQTQAAKGTNEVHA